MAEPRFHTIPYYTFASPRYQAINNTEINIVPEDYNRYDSINGTYDKFFPLYALTENEPPTLEVVNPAGQSSVVKGLLEFVTYRDKYTYRELGAKTEPVNLKNSNLESKKIFLQEHIHTKLSPGWSLIQTDVTVVEGKNTYLPKFIIRVLGNTVSTRYNLAIKLPTLKKGEAGFAANDFVPGMIVDYNNNLWKCLQATKIYPPATVRKPGIDEDVANEDWSYLNFDTNVFNADIFVFANNKTAYLAEINDFTRNFDPSHAQDDTLVCWNLSYSH